MDLGDFVTEINRGIWYKYLNKIHKNQLNEM